MSHTDTLTFLGDLYTPTPIAAVGSIPDRLILNLESPITDHVRGWPGKVNLRMRQADFPSCLNGKVMAVCLANNHICDYGQTGLDDTLETLKTLGIPQFGAGNDSENCGNPLILRIGKSQVAFLGYVCPTTHPVFCSETHPGVRPAQLERISEDIKIARNRGATHVVVSVHWGAEEVHLPKPSDVRLGRAIIEAGAELVLGHHAHCIQPWEIWRGKYIFYGLGNAFFPDLDVPAQFSNEGDATGRYRKRQFYWNRASLAVDWNVQTGAVSVRKLYAKSGKWIWNHSQQMPENLRYQPKWSPEKAYKYSLRWSRFRTILFSWMTNPKLPQKRHFRWLCEQFRVFKMQIHS